MVWCSGAGVSAPAPLLHACRRPPPTSHVHHRPPPLQEFEIELDVKEGAEGGDEEQAMDQD